MFTSIQDSILSLVHGKKKTSQGGWLSFNAVCCTHNGENADTRMRGGIKTNGDGGVSYHCFNCGWKASYQPGRTLSYKFRRLLKWMGASETEVSRLVLDALRIQEIGGTFTPAEKEERVEVNFLPRSLPELAQDFLSLATYHEMNNWRDVPQEYYDAVSYIAQRKIDMTEYEFYWTPTEEHRLLKRVVVPFYWQGKIVGYTARAMSNVTKPKYHSNHPSGFVFNLDKQRFDSKFVIVSEGPFDAMSVDGVAVLTNEISKQQADIIESLDREIIYVPDFDRKLNDKGKEVWAGYQAVEQAISYGWTVSFPVWRETCKDINEAVVKYGKLFVIKAILDGRETSPVKIKLLSK